MEEFTEHFEQSVSDGSSSASVFDEQRTQTPSTDTESMDQEDAKPIPPKKKKFRSQLDKLQADCDWYVTSYDKSVSSRRESSLKRKQLLDTKDKEREEELQKILAENGGKLPEKKPRPPRAPSVPKKKRIQNTAPKIKKVYVPGEEPKKSQAGLLTLKRLMVEADYYTKWSFGDAPSSYTREPSVIKKPVLYTDSDYPSNPYEYKRKKKVTVPKLFKQIKKPTAKPVKPQPKSKSKSKPKKKPNSESSEEFEESPEPIVKDEQIEPVYEPDPYEPLSLSEDVEVELFDRKFFKQSIYNHSIPQIDETAKLTSCNDVLMSNISRYNEIGFPKDILSIKSYLYPDILEDYLPLEPKDDELNPFEEIKTSMEMICAVYLKDEFKSVILNEVVPNYLEALKNSDYESFTESISKFHEIIQASLSSTDALEFVTQKKTISRYSIHQFLNQIYSRVVSPEVRKLRHYKAFSNYVYGELLPRFTSEVLHQVELNHTKKFFDLGSGVGNTVLQAALEFGAESYGCEIMEHASELTQAQLKEFEIKCNIFGFEAGKVEFFLNQSFVENQEIFKVLSDCDVILVNNYVFDADLNKAIVHLMKDLKAGTKVISLRSLVPPGFTFDTDNIESVLNRMDVQMYEMREASVSWTNSKVNYYIATVQKDIVEHYFIDHKVGRTRKGKTASATPGVDA